MPTTRFRLAGSRAALGFTNRVMARVRETANPPSLWERLFLPLRIKIPLQATAVVLIRARRIHLPEGTAAARINSGHSTLRTPLGEQNETDRLAPSVVQALLVDSKTKQVAEETKPRVQEFKDSIQLKDLQSRPKPEEQYNAPGTARQKTRSARPIL